VDGPLILFEPDGGPEIGGGHVMRSLTLAGALARAGAQPLFLADPWIARVVERFSGPGIAHTPERPDGFDAVVFDSYRLGVTDHLERGRGRPAMAIDDLADRPLGVDLVLDPGPARTASDYAGLVDDGATLLLGPTYALVRPEFAAAREAPRSGERVLLSLGLTDVGGITARVANRLLPRLGDAALDVVLGHGAPSREAVERLAARDPRVNVHIDTTDMAGLCASATLAVGAGGSSLWERCAAGLPSVVVVLADNQVPQVDAAEAAGACERVDARAPDFEAALDRAFTGLMRSPERRARMGRAAAGLCDGQGAERAAQALLGLLA